jgi:hypothetical protein
MAWTLFETSCASRALVKVELVAITGPEFDDRILGAGRIASVAFEAVAAGEASLRFELSLFV